MAKTIEQKAVDAIVTAMSDKTFKEHEFSRLMIEAVHSNYYPAAPNFMQIVYSFIVYLSTYDDYRYYPNGCEEIAVAAGRIRPYFDEAMGVNLQLTEIE